MGGGGGSNPKPAKGRPSKMFAIAADCERVEDDV